MAQRYLSLHVSASCFLILLLLQGIMGSEDCSADHDGTCGQYSSSPLLLQVDHHLFGHLVLEEESATIQQGPLVLIPGLGAKKRIPLVQENIRVLKEALGADFACVLVIYPKDAHMDVDYAAEHFAPCQVRYQPVSMWAAIKSISIDDLGERQRIFLLLDDHRLEVSTISKLQAVMDTEQVEMVAATDVDLPEAPGWCPHIKSHRGEIARGTRYIDFGANVISRKAFDCMQELANPDLNGIGHGYDNAFVGYCKMPVAVCDTCVTEHTSATTGGSVYSTEEAGKQKDRFRASFAEKAEYWSECGPETIYPLQGTSHADPLLVASMQLQSRLAAGRLKDELVMLSPAQLQKLYQIQQGEVAKSELEIVLAQYDESITWSDPYASIRTVYCKGPPPEGAEGCVRLPNVGREGHTYLHHIVENYDNLADWTVFSQAGEPTLGYMGHRLGGGHMLPGVTFHDYVLQHSKTGLAEEDGFFAVFTSAMHVPSASVSIRTSYAYADTMEQSRAHQTRCPSKEFSDGFEPWINLGWFEDHVSKKCSEREGFQNLSAFVATYLQDHVQAEMPEGGVIYYAQGARFAASKERIRARPKEFYERLLLVTGSDNDSCENYLNEWLWYYIIGKPRRPPCAESSMLLQTAQSMVLARSLNAGQMASTMQLKDSDMQLKFSGVKFSGVQLKFSGVKFSGVQLKFSGVQAKWSGVVAA
eukprot:TRINITY_DN4646_c0_g1_i1.p1 TRINITY_DN4646_c0_g1~~TRINITY_DN4646_c0_g1_i1.p1  ORF type:complete len:702 (-),score=97.77 TRINITY_DN4646_c0_g1_i1:121-2226(-)